MDAACIFPLILGWKREHIRCSVASPEFAIQLSYDAIPNECNGQVCAVSPHYAERRVCQSRDPACVDASEPLPVYDFNRHEPL